LGCPCVFRYVDNPTQGQPNTSVTCMGAVQWDDVAMPLVWQPPTYELHGSEPTPAPHQERAAPTLSEALTLRSGAGGASSRWGSAGQGGGGGRESPADRGARGGRVGVGVGQDRRVPMQGPSIQVPKGGGGGVGQDRRVPMQGPSIQVPKGGGGVRSWGRGGGGCRSALEGSQLCGRQGARVHPRTPLPAEHPPSPPTFLLGRSSAVLGLTLQAAEGRQRPSACSALQLLLHRRVAGPPRHVDGPCPRPGRGRGGLLQVL
jgi:hypothetical protein